MLTDVILEPLGGVFDANKLRRWLEQRDDTCIDPLGTGVYMIGGSADMVQILKERRTEKPERYPPCVLVWVTPEKVMIAQEWGEKWQRNIACEFAKTVFEEGNVRLHDGYGRDWTEHVRKEGMGVVF